MKQSIWPEEYRCAAMITVNLDGESIWTSMYPENVVAGSALYNMGETGMTTGLNRILEILKARKIKATFFVPGKIAEKYPEQIQKIDKQGHEIACHGYAHENLALLEPEESRKRLKKATDIIRRLTGKKPIGFRAPEGEVRGTEYQILKELGYQYSSTLSNDYMPYVGEEGLLEIPIHFSLCDFVYFASNIWPAYPYGQDRIPNYKKVLTNWIWEFDGFHEHGGCYVLQIDPQIMGVVGRVGILEEILDYIGSFKDCLLVTGKELSAIDQIAYKSIQGERV